MRNHLKIGVLGGLGAMVSLIAGCGGGGGVTATGSGGGSGSGTGTGSPANITATFKVHVATGQVEITNSNGQTTTSAKSGDLHKSLVLSGTALGFNSSTVIDVPGSPGYKVLNVSLTNNYGLPLGVDANGNTTGLNVVFGPIQSLVAPPNLSLLTNVSTLAGIGTAGFVNGPASSALFRKPTGVAVLNGVTYVVDSSNNVIRTISNGQVGFLAGGKAGDVDGVGSAAGFSSPSMIAVNPVDKSLIVSDYGSHRIRRVTTDGRVSTVAGIGTAGGTNGTGDVASLNAPVGVAVDSTGTIFVAEYYGQRIRKITLGTGLSPTNAANYTVSTFAGSGTPGTTDGIGTAAAFNYPAGIALGSDGSLYVCDSAVSSIRRIAPTGEVVRIIGSLGSGNVDGLGTAAKLKVPYGITYSNGSLFIADNNNDEIRQMSPVTSSSSLSDPGNWLISNLGGNGSVGFGNGTGSVSTFNLPTAVTTDASGNLLVADSANNAIRKVVPTSGSFPIGVATGTTGTEIPTLANSTGVIPSTGAGTNLPYLAYSESIASGATSSAKPWNFIVPSGVTDFTFTVTVLTDASVYVPQGWRSGIGSPDVMVRTLAGGSISGFENGSASTARFNGPELLAVDRAGIIYAADQYNCAIRRVTPDGTTTTIANPSGLPGYVDGSGLQARFSYPAGITCSPDGSTLFVADGGYRVRRIAYQGGSPDDPANWSVSTIAGTGVQGGNYYSIPTGLTATFNSLGGIAIDSAGSLYVAELSGNRIRKITFSGGDPSYAGNYTVKLMAGDYSAISGASGTTDGLFTNARFSSPYGLAVDAVGNVFVTDIGDHRIRMITQDLVVTTVAGGTSGSAAIAGYVDGPGITARFTSPVGIAVDRAGTLFIADSGDQHIRAISGGNVYTVAGPSTTVAGSINGSGSVATFYNPASVALSPSGTLYVGETNNNWIRAIDRVVSSGTN